MRLSDPRPAPVVGILYAGEMGSSLGRVLVTDGLRVVTTTEGRGPRTARLCREAGLEALPTLADVARVADVVLSLVPPSAALEAARQYAAQAHAGPPGRLYVDANAISPVTVEEIGRVMAAAGVDFVDAAINGLASRLRDGAAVFLSGARADEVARLFGQALNVRVVGDAPGKASALKGALAGLSKGLTALFAEIAVTAGEAGVGDLFRERCRAYYPGVMEVVDRMLPTYPQHARRRADEMGELDRAAAALGLRPDMVHAAERVTRAMAAALEGPHDGPWTADGVLEALRVRGALRAAPPEGGAS